MSARVACASSNDLNFTTPRGYARGASFQNLAQCLKNRSNRFPRAALTGAAFISSIDRNFSTGISILSQVESLSQRLGVLTIQRANRVPLEFKKRSRSCDLNPDSLNVHHHRLDIFE
jgi:hypothetical protein